MAFRVFKTAISVFLLMKYNNIYTHMSEKKDKNYKVSNLLLYQIYYSSILLFSPGLLFFFMTIFIQNFEYVNTHQNGPHIQISI